MENNVKYIYSIDDTVYYKKRTPSPSQVLHYWTIGKDSIFL